MGAAPPNFPSDIPVQLQRYSNWSETIVVDQLWTCAPKTADDVVAVCNWAKSRSPAWQVRPKGIGHGWSPLTITEGTPSGANIIVVDTSQHLTALKFIPANGSAPAMVQAGVGAKMLNLLTFLQYQQGGNGPASGFAFPHVPAPGNLTVGGVLAINGHGTAVPSANEDFASSYGSLSDHITALTAVVSSENEPFDYELRTFQRDDPDAPALLVHAGRAFLVSATLQLIDNFNLRCQSFMDIPAGTLFAAPSGPTPPADSLASHLEASGRVEAIWYPFTDEPWLKVWTAVAARPAGSTAVYAPYNYAFSDNLPGWVTSTLKTITTTSPDLTPTFEKSFAAFTKTALSFGLADLWGPSMNTLLYIRDTTLLVTANGYAIQMQRADVQQAVHDFVEQFQAMLTTYAAAGKYPVNAPLEIRVTGLDDASGVHVPSGGPASTPLISALTHDDVARANGFDCAVWFDVLTLPGTPFANEFYAELESWFAKRFVAPAARLLPEWSKGWAYTESSGGWTDPAFLAGIRAAFTDGRTATDDWNAVVATLQKFDRSNLFSNGLLDTLFVKN